MLVINELMIYLNNNNIDRYYLKFRNRKVNQRKFKHLTSIKNMRPHNDSYQKSNQHNSSHATATKSPDRRVNQTQAYTPTRFSRKPSDRVNQFKNTLNQCIDNLAGKRETNRQAVEQVKQVNKQLLDTMSTTYTTQSQRGGGGYHSSRNRLHQDNYSRIMNMNQPPIIRQQQKQRDMVTHSSFHMAPADNLYRQSQSNFHMSQVYRPESVMSGHTAAEVEDLRQRIRNERGENEVLQGRVESLRREQVQLGGGMGTTGGGSSGGQMSYLMSENSRLHNQLSRLQSQQSIQSIYEEFMKLKQDNERLRKQTINMLKNAKY